jgi:hypothetical protein
MFDTEYSYAKHHICTPSPHLLLHVLKHPEIRSRHLYILAPSPVHTDSTRPIPRKGPPLLAEASECRLSIDAGGTSLKDWCDISPGDRAVLDRQHMAGSESCCSEDATSCEYCVGVMDKQANGSSRGKMLGHRIFVLQTIEGMSMNRSSLIRVWRVVTKVTNTFTFDCRKKAARMTQTYTDCLQLSESSSFIHYMIPLPRRIFIPESRVSIR